ncbi:MAG: ABC transporter permease [Saprospiraceae bacterium]|nr:ABC transporter permease [Saprospiraceae bacterium]
MNRNFSIRWDKYTYFIAWSILALFAIVGIFAPLIATDQPYYIKKDNRINWTMFKDRVTIAENFQNYDEIKLAPIPFRNEGYTNLNERFVPPGTKVKRGPLELTHYLGTDRLGRDVAAGIVFGCRKSLLIAIISIGAASFIGILLGALAGYWGNKLPVRWSWSLLPVMVLICYLLYLIKYTIMTVSIGILCMIALVFVIYFILKNRRPSVFAPVDQIILKLIETFQSIPALLLLMVIAALIDSPTLITLALIIALVRWTSFARITRAEVMKVNAQDYITAARVSGLSHRKIITHYILPETLGPLVVVFAFGISSVILLESTLSFLGIGIPIDQVTWGTLLAQARQSTNAWWLALFPGLCIMLLVFSLNLIGSHLKQHFDAQD